MNRLCGCVPFRIFRFHSDGVICWYRLVKFFAASLLVLCAFATSACNTLVTRRDLYSPAKGSGKYTTILQKSLYIYGVQPQPHAPPMTPAPLPEVEIQPLPPVPPPPSGPVE